jgi:hypothetical protein
VPALIGMAMAALGVALVNRSKAGVR